VYWNDSLHNEEYTERGIPRNRSMMDVQEITVVVVRGDENGGITINHRD
jgi:hypothetical protein